MRWLSLPSLMGSAESGGSGGTVVWVKRGAKRLELGRVQCRWGLSARRRTGVYVIWPHNVRCELAV